MKSRFLLLYLLFGIVSGATGQAVDLTFTAVDNAARVQPDSIRVMNRTQEADTVLYWPDTTLSYQMSPGDTLLYIGYATGFPVGVQQMEDRMAQFRLYPCIPNPVGERAEISLLLPSGGPVNISVSDIRGRVAANLNRELQKGRHRFVFYPGDERICLLTARWNGSARSIKILAEGSSGTPCRLEYTGDENENPELKHSPAASDPVVQESGIPDAPAANETYTFQFATGIPCPGTPTVEYGGQLYHTIQIRSQCWLRENLNLGTMIQGGENMADNGTVEKYCYDNAPDSCAKYGGLYQWDEMMQYTALQGARGICPPGWHLPSDEEWKVLEGAADSHYWIGEPEWDLPAYRGYDAGTNLKSSGGWHFNTGNGTDLFGFSGLPGGSRSVNGLFYDLRDIGFWWSSSAYGSDHAWRRGLYYFSPESGRGADFVKQNGASVRCLMDY